MDDERFSLTNSTDTAHQTPTAVDHTASEDDDEEALSLSDLPLLHQPRKQLITGSEDINKCLPKTQDDFDFCSKESEMSAADEIFHQGQFLPFGHSGNRLSQINLSRSVSRSESMDYHSSIASRSSSSSSSAVTTAASNYPKPPRNLFHSLPSPSPKLQQAPTSTRANSRTCTRKSSAWNIFRLGLLTTPPKISFQDLKTRTNDKNFGSRNSTSSNSSSLSSNSADKKKASSSNFLGGCKCALDAVDTVPSKVGFMKRSMSEGNSEMRALQMDEEANLLAAVKSTKKRVSDYRTFEWLKQLSIDGTPDEP